MEAAQFSIQKFLKIITEEEEKEVEKQEEEKEEQNDEEFYEEIEAPKFVDFTASDDPFRPDDCYWFCLRVGCDRKHEEELDPEEISKNFVLRVMAARSPNIRLRRVLKGRNTSMKCPLSAPAKSSKSRIPRLAMVSSMSQKMLDNKGKVGTHPKINTSSTPMVKGKQVPSKYMTTPRNKRNPSQQTSFRSVQNPRPTNTAVPKTSLVAKALVFQSPKKAMPAETSVETHTPVTKLCEGMKGLEITSQRKRLLGYSGKSAKGSKCTQNLIATESSRKQRTTDNGKCMPLQAKSLRKARTNKQILAQQSEKVCEDDNSNEKIDVKSKDGTALDLKVIERYVQGKPLKMTQKSENVVCTDSKEDATKPLSNLDTSVNTIPTDGSLLIHTIAFDGKEHEEHQNTRVSENEVSVLSEVTLPSGKRLDTLAKDRIKVEDHARISSKEETMHNDDKENGQASDENRNFNCNNNDSKKKCLGRKQTHENVKKVVRKVDKKVSVPTTTSASDVINRKPKPTNPKPFRLRTDERGILREANMERKFHHPQAQATEVPSSRSGNSQGRRIKHISENDKSKGCNDNPECGDKESLKEVHKTEAKWCRTARLQTIREQACKTPQRCFKSVQKIANFTTSLHNNVNNSENKKPECCIRKSQSPLMRQPLVRPQGKPMHSTKLGSNGLCVIKETSELKTKSAGKPYRSGIDSVTKSTFAASRSSSQGRSSLTMPRCSSFQSANVCKKNQGCTKNIV